jgi:hypothetical protein
MEGGARVNREVKAAVSKNMAQLRAMLYEHGLTMEEVGEIFGSTRQAVEVSFRKHNIVYRKRSPAHPKGQPAWLLRWQNNTLRDFVKAGMTITEARELLSIPSGSRVGAGLASQPSAEKQGMCLAALGRVRSALIDLVFLEAWEAGASRRDLALIMGWTEGGVAQKAHRLRQEGVTLARRRVRGESKSKPEGYSYGGESRSSHRLDP